MSTSPNPSAASSTPRSTAAGLPSIAASAPLTVTPKSSTTAGEKGSHNSSTAGAGSVVGPGEKDKATKGLGLPLDSAAAQNVSSPAELVSFVDTMLAQLEDKFNESSTEVLEKMSSMSTRIDSLELAISDIINSGELLPTAGPNGTQ